MENKQREKSAAEAYREERKQRMAKAAKKQSKKNPNAAKAGRIIGKVIAIVLAVAICLAAVGGILNFFGVPQKVLKAAKFGSEKDTVATYNYYYMTLYNYYYNMSNQYDTYYGSGMGKMYTGYDTSKTPMDQDYTGDTSSLNTDEEIKTWADFLKVSALNYMQSYTAYADLARKNGLTLNDDEKAEIDDRIASIKTNAESSDFSLDRYIQKIYGKGVTEKVLRAALEDSTLASKYAQQKQTEISDAITDDEIMAEYQANPNNYTTLSVSAFKVTANADVQSDASDEEKAAANTAAMSEAKTAADKYAANVKSADDLLKQAQSYNSSLTSSSVALSDTTYSSISSSFGSAAADWAVSSDRKVGEVGVIEADDGYVVMYITATAHLDDTKAVNVRHILFQFKSTDSSGSTANLTDEQKSEYYSKAKAVYDQYLENPTEDNFATLANNNSDDTGSNTNGGLYEDVKPGQMVTQFNDWCFDPSRKPGDTGIIETTYGYHIMYFVGTADETVWKANIRSSLASTKFEEFDKELISDTGDYAKKVNKSVVKWAAKKQEKLIKNYTVNSKYNSRSTSTTSSNASTLY
ncbi:MAG: peptidylprolyl isomerase [Ruminococcus sp.]|nr:peptidylprolyl isomerase [Ruminococcus sp.]MDY3894713.1 peptidylprolyl isomerase [Candidatus Fimenecus sp.]